MAKANLAHLGIQPTTVLQVEFQPLPPMPGALARLPGAEEWYQRLQRQRELEKTAVQRMLYAQDGFISLSPPPQPVLGPVRRIARQPCVPSAPPQPPTPPSTIFILDLLYLKNQDTGNYCPLTIVGPEGIEQIAFDAELPFPGPPIDLIADLIYLKNTDTGNYCPLTLTGLVGAQQIEFGAEVVLTDATADILVNVIYFKNQTTGNYCTVTLVGMPFAPQFNFGPELPL